MNTKEEILNLTKGDKGWSLEDLKKPQFFDKDKIKDALKILDFEFNSGYGGENGYAIYVWTKTKIVVKGTYDGAEWYEVIPRNPDKDIVPSSIGGG